jgi:hypothetical protein
MSFTTATVTECLYLSTTVGATLASFTSEAVLNTVGTMGVQANLPTNFWLPNQSQTGRGFYVRAFGILSSTGTPTYTFTVRLGGSASVSGPVVLGSAALQTASGASNQFWELDGYVSLTAMGGVGANSTVRGTGRIISPGLTGTNAGINPLYGGSASPGTVTTVDTSITNFVNVNVACSANSGSNSITLQQLVVLGLN